MTAPLRLFVDESYGAEDYYVAGVLVTPTQYTRLRDGLNAVREHARTALGVPEGAELHAHRLMQTQGDWSVLRGRLHEAVAVYRNALRAVVSSGASVYLDGVDVTRLRRRYRYPDPPYEVVLRRLLERVDAHCASLETTCTVTADLIDRQQDFLEAIEGRSRVHGSRPTPLTLERVLPPTWVDSASEPGIEAADMAAYILRRHREVTGSAKAARTTRSLVHTLAPAVVHEEKWLP